LKLSRSLDYCSKIFTYMDNSLTYVIAVSGGVDSVVLLHKIVSRLASTPKKSQPEYVVAHFDHGIRGDSYKDAELVKKLAKQYGLKCEVGKGNLPANVSESDARDARYTFLRKIKNRHQAEKIITAHHQDDVLETMIINILRGTGPRGLVPMQNSPDILRPLLNSSKKALLEYARKNNLVWHEDSTNADDKYLRNYIRIHIMPELYGGREKLLHINHKLADIISEIDIRIPLLLPKNNSMSRSGFVVLPYIVRKEVFKAWILRHGVTDVDKKMIEKGVVAIATLVPGKKINIGGQHWLSSNLQNVVLTLKKA